MTTFKEINDKIKQQKKLATLFHRQNAQEIINFFRSINNQLNEQGIKFVFNPDKKYEYIAYAFYNVQESNIFSSLLLEQMFFYKLVTLITPSSAKQIIACYHSIFKTIVFERDLTRDWQKHQLHFTNFFKNNYMFRSYERNNLEYMIKEGKVLKNIVYFQKDIFLPIL